MPASQDPSGSTGLAYRPGLDGVRALAVGAVLAFHDGRLRGGFLGVSAFFTLSGFLITGLLLRERAERSRISLANFFARRLRRLVPAAVLGVGLAASVAVTLGESIDGAAFRGDGLAALGNVLNWRFILVGRSYADLFSGPSPLTHYWSLAVEEQFYLVLAPATAGILALARGRRRALTIALGVLALASVAAGWWHVRGGNLDRAYYGSDARALEFLVGALLAIGYAGRRFSRAGGRAVALAGPVALVFLAYTASHWREDDLGLFRGGLLTHALAVCAVLVAACEPGPLRALLSIAPLRALGRISYGVYVYHWPLFLLLTRDRTDLGRGALTAVRIGVTVAIAVVSYVVVERPIRTGRAIVGFRARIAVPAVVSAAAVAIVVAASMLPAPSILLPSGPAGDMGLSGGTGSIVAAPAASDPDETCADDAGDPVAPGRRRVLVVGDSVALTLGLGLCEWAAAHDLVVFNRAFLGCSLWSGVDARRLTTRGEVRVRHIAEDVCGIEANWPRVMRQLRPAVVVAMFGYWEVFDVSWDGGETWHAPGDATWAAQYARRIERAAQLLGAGGAQVLWLAPPCFAGNPRHDLSDGDWFDRARVDALADVARRVADSSDITVSDVLPRTQCPVDFDVRPDGSHFSVEGALAAAEVLGPEILDVTPPAPATIACSHTSGGHRTLEVRC